jgi:GNAT superfamily N-acetyltransferase
MTNKESQKEQALNEYSLQPFDINSEKHLRDLVYLFGSAFKKKLGQEYFKKKYDTAYTGVPAAAYLAYKENDVAAFYGAIPQLWAGKERTIKVGHACEFITHPSHQRKGLNTRLAGATAERMQQSGVELMYAFHSDQTHRAAKKSAWSDIGQMYVWEMMTHKLPISQIKHRLRLPTSALQKIRAEFDEVVTPRTDDSRITETLSDALRNYRSFTNNCLVQIKDVQFWLKLDAILHVGWFNAPDAGALQSALNTLSEFCKKKGIAKISFHVDGSGVNYAQLQELNCEFKPSWVIGGLELVEGLPLKQFQFDYRNFDTF